MFSAVFDLITEYKNVIIITDTKKDRTDKIIKVINFFFTPYFDTAWKIPLTINGIINCAETIIAIAPKAQPSDFLPASFSSPVLALPIFIPALITENIKAMQAREITIGVIYKNII